MNLQGRIHALYRSADGALTEGSDPDFVAHALTDESGLVWVDLHVQSEEDGDFLRDVFDFHPLTIEDSVTARVDPAKADDYGGYIFIVVQALCRYDPDRELQATEVDFYLGHNYVVSCHLNEVPAIVAFQDRSRRDIRLMSRGSDWLLHGLLDALVDEYLPIVDAVDDSIDDIEARMLHRPGPAILQEVMLAKRNALRLRRATTPQREIMVRLARGEFPALISDDVGIYFRDIYDHLVRIEYLVETVRDLADGALTIYLSSVSNRLNEVMKVLTAAATIFLPLTVITGIYGMNFEENQFPSFSAPWGFAAVIIFMIVNSIVMLAYFRWRRWI